MLKMFSTQLTGLFQRIQENETFSLEDGARLLAQAAVGQGSIYLYGTKEMLAVTAEAIEGAEPLTAAKNWREQEPPQGLSGSDRALIISRYSTDKEALCAAKKLIETGIPFVAVSTAVPSAEEDLTSLADVHIDIKLTRGLLPDENGNRFGYPSPIAALFVYYGLKFTVDEILAEYED